MKIAVQFNSDSSGKNQCCTVAYTDWEKPMARLKKYEHTLKINTDLKEAFKQLEQLIKSEAPKQTRNDFLNNW